MNRPTHCKAGCLSENVCCASVCVIFIGLLSATSCASLGAQATRPTPQAPAAATGSVDAGGVNTRIDDLERRIENLSETINQTQQMVAKSLVELQQLRGQLDSLRDQTVTARQAEGTVPGQPPNGAQTRSAAGIPRQEDIETIREEQAAMQAEIKQHDQIKVETASKYPLRVRGLVLFNAFANAGVVDNTELPTLAFPRNPGSSHGSAGATFRQTLLGLEATGPRIAGARSMASVNIDFFGGTSSNAYGYNSTAGLVRMRESRVSLDWRKTTVQASFSGPLISPLSPQSYATVAQPALSGSGNLWTWSPQFSVEQRIPFSDRRRLAFDGGVIYPPSPGYTAIQLDSPVEASRRPGYEGHISYQDDGASGATPHPFALGVGAYSSSQFYSGNAHIHSWAFTADWQIPISRWFELTGEAYRGRALAGLGGGVYKDTLTGRSIVDGLTRTRGVDAAGGWSQLNLRLRSTLEANVMFGLDNAFSSNFDGLVLMPSSNALQSYARNSSIAGNLIFRPKTYLILSPEYRRIRSWRYTGPADVANVFTISAGYEF